MAFEHILFWLVAAGAILTSLMVIMPPGGKNPLYGALALIVSFVFMSGLYVLLVAHMMAVVQVLVYAGAIMVLFTFVIMLLNLSDKELGEQRSTMTQWLGLGAMVAIGVKAVIIVDRSAEASTANDLTLPAGFGTVEAVGDALFREYLFPFELASILLLVAVVGAVVLAKRTL
ncbi:MAG: NADH-quinone oxidoreductase subunit J [Myxococcota bacterium]|jgi:NADH-quinone oxidoreductase subunit J